MKRSPKTRHLAWRVIEGKAYIVNTRTSTLHELDEVGTFIWERIDNSADRIIADIVETYDVSREQARVDLDEFLDTLAGRGLVER